MILIAPIIFDTNLYGLLWINRDSVNSDLTRDEEEILEFAANQIAAMVEMDWLEKSEVKTTRTRRNPG